MRRLFVLTVAVIMVMVGSTVALAGNQEEANRIAKALSQQFPQYNIEVAYRDGNVRLRGEIQSEADRAAISQYVKRIARVRSISDKFTFANNTQNSVAAAPTQVAIPFGNTDAQNGLVPISVTAEQENFLPVSSLRADEDVYVAQVPTNYSDSSSLAVPSIVTDGDVLSSSEVSNFNADTVAQNFVQTNGPMPMGTVIAGDGAQPSYNAPRGQNMGAAQGNQPNLPNYAWPTTADYPNYAQISYPKQYAAGAFPYIGPFYPYPQVPLGWRKVTMEWHDGYWWLDFNDGSTSGPFSPLFRQPSRYR